MLRSQPTKAKDKPGDRMGLFSVLCSPQGKQDLPALSGDALADIRGMLGAQVSGAGGAAFERLVNKKYLFVWTPGGKPKKGKLTESQDALEKAREDLAKCVALMAQVAALESSAQRTALPLAGNAGSPPSCHGGARSAGGHRCSRCSRFGAGVFRQ